MELREHLRQVDNAYIEGKFAKVAGRTLEDVPYTSENIRCYRAWRDGFVFGAQDEENTKHVR